MNSLTQLPVVANLHTPAALPTSHVETVCLLSKLHEAKHHVNVTVDMDEMDLTAAESKATYEEIKNSENNNLQKVN